MDKYKNKFNFRYRRDGWRYWEKPPKSICSPIVHVGLHAAILDPVIGQAQLKWEGAPL